MHFLTAVFTAFEFIYWHLDIVIIENESLARSSKQDMSDYFP
jgi:hypothetical protein